MKHKRHTITAQLVSGKDEDLIMWLTSLPAGQRNQTIKTLLRRALALPQPTIPLEVDPADFNAIVEQLSIQQQHITALSAEVERLRQQIAAGIVMPPSTKPQPHHIDDNDPPADPALQRRAARLNRQSW